MTDSNTFRITIQRVHPTQTGIGLGEPLYEYVASLTDVQGDHPEKSPTSLANVIEEWFRERGIAFIEQV